MIAVGMKNPPPAPNTPIHSPRPFKIIVGLAFDMGRLPGTFLSLASLYTSGQKLPKSDSSLLYMKPSFSERNFEPKLKFQ